MSNFYAFWLHEINRKTAVLLVILIFLINATMNGAMGYNTGDQSVLYGLVFFAFAGLGAWAMCEQAHLAGLKRAACLMLVAVQLIIGQLAGWQQFGLTLERGAGRLDARASARETIDSSFAGYRAERAAIIARRPELRPVGSVIAERDLECSRTSRQFPDGRGPKCTALESELADMERLMAIRDALPAMARAKASGPQIRNSEAHIAAPTYFSNVLRTWLFGGEGDASPPIGPEDVRFGLMVFFTFALEVGATLGFWLVGVGAPPAAGRGNRGMAPANDDPPPRGMEPISDRHLRAGHPIDVMPVQRRLAAPPVFDALAAPAPGATSAHGAPVSVVINGWGGRDYEVADRPAAAAIGDPHTDAPARRERSDLGPLPGDAPPVDRTRLQRAFSDDEQAHVDVLAAFAAACVIDVPGGVVSGRDLYRRYSQWAGGRAVTEQAFFDLFPDVTAVRVSDIGGIAHAEGVALRASQPLEIVA